VSVSNRGSGAATQHNCPYRRDPFRSSGKFRRVCFPEFRRNLVPSERRKVLTQRHSAVSRKKRIFNKMLEVPLNQAPAGTHHTNSPSAHHLRDTNASVKRFLLLPTVALNVNCQTAQLKGEDVRLLQPSGITGCVPG
jgi:hypothetical protein